MRKSILRAQARAVMGRGAVLHASAAEINGKGVIFTALSGGGKTTAVMLLQEEGYRIIGQDSTIVCRGTDDVWRIFPCASWTWESGDERTSLSLGGIVFLEKGEPGTVTMISPYYATYRIFRDTLIMAYGDLERIERPIIRQSVRKMCRNIPCHLLRYSRSESLSDLVESLSP